MKQPIRLTLAVDKITGVTAAVFLSRAAAGGWIGWHGRKDRFLLRDVVTQDGFDAEAFVAEIAARVTASA